MAATLILGALLFSFYSVNPGLPADIPGDAILPHFIVNDVPSGASGFLVAAIFAAAMSSIDSALHSLATCITVDFYERYSKAPLDEARSLKVAQGLIVLWGVLGIFAAFYVANQETDLLQFLIEFTTMFVAPLLGLFLMGALFPRINATGAFYGTVATVIFLKIGTDAGALIFPGIWRSAIVAPIAVILGYFISLLCSAPAERAIEGLTLWTKTKTD